MPPQGKDKNKNGSQLGGANSGPKSGGRNNGQKRFEEAGKSSSSSKQNEETKKVSSSIRSNSEAVKTSSKRKRNGKNKKENEKKMSPTPEGNKSSELGSSAGSGTISEPETKRCAGEEESGVPCIFKKGYLKVSKRNKMFKEQKEEFENTILQKDKDFKALVKELDGCFEKNKKLKDEIAVTKAELKTVKNKFEKLEKFHFLLEIPHNTVVNIKEMMDLDAEKFYERIYELNIELCHSAGKKKRKVQKKIYKDPRELLDKAEKILADEGDGIFACELIWASFALVMARFFMKWNINIRGHRALGELAKYTVRFHKKPSARDFLRLFVKDIHNTHRIFYSGKYEIEEVEEYIKDSRKFINYMKAINENALFADFKYYFPSGDELYREFAQKVYINVINEDICVFGDGPYRFYYQAADTPQIVKTQETVTPKK